MLLLVRGVPGTGKSTYAKEVAERENFYHFEADQFFVKKGEYKFDPAFLFQAHKVCYEKTKHYLYKDLDVVVSNTFTRFKEMKEYVALAGQCGTVLRVITMSHEYGNIHGVPEEKLTEMRTRFETQEMIFYHTQQLLDDYTIDPDSPNCFTAYPPNYERLFDDPIHGVVRG